MRCAVAIIDGKLVQPINQHVQPLTELVARRLGEEFNCDYQWLMGTSDAMEKPTPRSRMGAAGNAGSLSLFPVSIVIQVAIFGALSFRKQEELDGAADWRILRLGRFSE